MAGRVPVALKLIDEADDSFGSLLAAIQGTLRKEGDCFELNRLTMTGKQVALALERRREVEIIEDKQKLFVVKRREPRPFVRAITMGWYD